LVPLNTSNNIGIWGRLLRDGSTSGSSNWRDHCWEDADKPLESGSAWDWRKANYLAWSVLREFDGHCLLWSWRRLWWL